MVQIHTHARFPRSKKWLTYHVAVTTGNPLAVVTEAFLQVKSQGTQCLPGQTVEFVAQWGFE